MPEKRATVSDNLRKLLDEGGKIKLLVSLINGELVVEPPKGFFWKDGKLKELTSSVK